jgi:photosystem II stability/assembly factor-like uncharacterized protein
MAHIPILYAGTVGQGVWRSPDGGDSWRRASKGMFPESDIRAIAVNPDNASILFAGTEAGIYLSADGGDSWVLLDSPMNDMQIWSLAISPQNSNTVYAGTCPSALFKSDDGGDSWRKLDVDLAPPREGAPIISRVTTVTIDPEDDQTVYMGVEIDGMRISRDGGETWAAGNEGLSSLDIHGLTVVPGSPKTLVAGTNNDVCVTHDMVNWTRLNVKEHYPWSYCRGVLHLSNGVSRVFVGAGNGPPGDEGGLFYTSDLGQSWERADLGMTSNSTIWAIAHNPAVDGWIVAYSVAGQLFKSTDNGSSWTKLMREFGEVRAVALAPGQ